LKLPARAFISFLSFMVSLPSLRRRNNVNKTLKNLGREAQYEV
jgi:hypothetical protein